VGAHCPALESLRCRVAVRIGGAALRALFAAARNAAEDRRHRELLAAALSPPPLLPAAPAAAEDEDEALDEGFGGLTLAAADEGLWGDDGDSMTGSTTTTATLGLTGLALGGGGGGGGGSLGGTPDRRAAVASLSPVRRAAATTPRRGPAPARGSAGPVSSLTTTPQRGTAAALRPPRAAATIAASPGAFALPLLGLDLWRSLEVDDASLRLVAAHCPALRELCLDGCDVAVTDAGVAAVAAGCRGLRALSLAGVPVSDVALAAVARQCRGLAFLDLSGGADFTGAGLAACVHALPRLQTLRARRCSGVSDGFLRALVRACPLLASLDIASCGQREQDVDYVGITEMGSSAFWRDGAPGPPPPEEALAAALAAVEDGPVREDRLTARALDMLAEATWPPRGRLTSLNVAFVPAITVEALYRFVRGTCARPGCSLVELRAVAGVATPLLARLLVRRLLLDDMPPRRPEAAAAAAAAAAPQEAPPASVAIALVDAEPVMPPAAAAAAAAAPAAAAPARSMRELREAALARLAAVVPGMRIS